MIGNAGKETATNVELVFNWKPPCLNVWRSRNYTERMAPDGRYVLLFESLAPNEYFGCELLSVNHELPALITARSDQCVAQHITMYPQPVPSVWWRRVSVLLMWAGVALAVYTAIVLLQFVILATPFGR